MAKDVIIDAFQDWDSKGAVRVKERRRAIDGCTKDSVYFNPNLIPVMRHPAVIERGAEFCRNVQIFHLFRYLEYTDFIEIEIVNRSVHPILRHRLPWSFSDTMLLGAYKVYVDEGYHAEMSVNMRTQIRNLIDLPPQEQAFPKGLRRVVELIESVPPEHTDLMYLMASVVSETLISNNLKQASDDSVVAPVRQLIHDHFLDESVHHNYFSCLFNQVWPVLDANQKILAGKYLPLFIQAFLMGDPGVTRNDLVSLGMPDELADQVVADSYGDNKPAPEVLRKAANATLALFRKNGVFDLEAAAGAFMAVQLIDHPSQLN